MSKSPKTTTVATKKPTAFSFPEDCRRAFVGKHCGQQANEHRSQRRVKSGICLELKHIIAIMTRMNLFRTEFVGGPQDESVSMPKSENVREILERLWCIRKGKKSGIDFDWFPDGEFSFRLRNSSDRIFRFRDLEGRRLIGVEKTEHDADPGCGGLDLLG
jgi:hypothetical protein